ncbi:hypothetical protein DNTS_000385 [Danionella cerebrum]|uniref:Uncharacterized protein n=1 Tax=Danionella cerebrum TaxID=2873325 RepID=A0A553PWY3_9TELE|nr:hypothetical protein DNTS_000385 [Danionella translucida]
MTDDRNMITFLSQEGSSTTCRTQDMEANVQLPRKPLI